MATFEFSVNGESRTVDLDPDTPLLWALRDTLGLTGTKYSCGIGLCGTCTVLIDGYTVRSCATTVLLAAGKSITTIEGLSADRSHALQKAWIAEEACQCGYCAPGQILNATALLSSNPSPTDADIDAAMSGVICRCGSYGRIRKAIKRAAEEG